MNINTIIVSNSILQVHDSNTDESSNYLMLIAAKVIKYGVELSSCMDKQDNYTLIFQKSWKNM